MQAAKREMLASRIRSALAMARLMLDEVLRPEQAAADPEGMAELAGKAGGEMAMLLRLAARALPCVEDQRAIRELARRLAPWVRDDRTRRSLCLRPSRAAMHGLAHLCLNGLGVPDDAFDATLRAAFASSVHAANERVPYRMLDAAWARHLAFGDAELDHPALMLSPIGAGVDLLQMTVQDAYAFTHALPYASDFGRVPLPDRVDREWLMGHAEAIALKALDEDDLDLLAEVLMAPAILRLPWSPLMIYAWHVLEATWREWGFVPGPGLPEPQPGETRAQASRRVIGTIYHTTFAAGLCAATLLACNALPPQFESLIEDAHAAPLHTKAKLCAAHWRHRMPLLTLGLELTRAVESGDLAALRGIAQRAAQIGLVQHPLFEQALEMLERTCLPGRGSGREQLPQHVGQDAAMLVVVDLDRRVDAQCHRQLALAAVG